MGFSLIPREKVFFDLFERASHTLTEASALLVQTMENFNQVAESARRMERLEHNADQITHEIMARLNRTFITPFDREDIHRLASALDDVVDFIEATTERFILFKVDSITPHAQELSKVIHQQAQEIDRVMPKLRRLDHGNVMPHCIEINRLENVADRIVRAALAELFQNKNGANSIEVIKWKELYDLLESATDKGEEVAVVIESIVLKNA
ncbi:MAG: DUF47 domain-containing protein [Deltaproteobacteria bacterium]|nr:DUF47 domain-containing protein [Deltaproteobacteria bacterium]